MKVSLPPNIGYIGVPTVHPTEKEIPPFSVVRGQVFALLDPVRDAAFLNHSVTDALGNTIPDMGLGVVDNGIFLYTTKQAPGNVAKTDAYGNRLYPIKFFWLGSPRGTTDASDHFSIFVADVDPSGFYPGAPASSFLRNPRLVLSWQQAKNDIVNWFDAHYPYTATPPSNGVGQETPNGQSNTAYGTLTTSSQNIPPGNVSVMQSIDGQFWPVYDYVDNSIILYFSWKTPNFNTLSIYAYKTLDSEIQSPLTSSQFLGGLSPAKFAFGDPWASSTFPMGNENAFGGASVFSSHRFSILSPDPLNSYITAGGQSAVFAYAGGFIGGGGSVVDHGVMMFVAVLQDIHNNPVSPQPLNAIPLANGTATYAIIPHLYVDSKAGPVDKLGQIFPVAETPTGGYAIVYNATSQSDVRPSFSGPVSGTTINSGLDLVLSAMTVRVAFFDYFTQQIFVAEDPLVEPSVLEHVGACRPQFTTFPDGLPKLIYNAWHSDQSIVTKYVYVDPAKLRPEGHRRLRLVGAGGRGVPGWFIKMWGKHGLRMLISSASIPADPSDTITGIQIVEVSRLDAFTANPGGPYPPNYTYQIAVKKNLVLGRNQPRMQAIQQSTWQQAFSFWVDEKVHVDWEYVGLFPYPSFPNNIQPYGTLMSLILEDD